MAVDGVDPLCDPPSASVRIDPAHRGVSDLRAGRAVDGVVDLHDIHVIIQVLRSYRPCLLVNHAACAVQIPLHKFVNGLFLGDGNIAGGRVILHIAALVHVDEVRIANASLNITFYVVNRSGTGFIVAGALKNLGNRIHQLHGTEHDHREDRHYDNQLNQGKAL